MSSKRRKKTVTNTHQGPDDVKSWGKAIAVGVLAIGTGLYYYLKSGAGSEKNAALIPDPIEDLIDRIVDELNRKVGQEWGDKTLNALEKELEHMLPPAAVSLVKIVHKAELLAKSEGLRPSDKKKWALNRIEALGFA